jgi:hypothetical protein
MDCHYSIAQGTDTEAEICNPNLLWNQDHLLPYPPGSATGLLGKQVKGVLSLTSYLFKNHFSIIILSIPCSHFLLLRSLPKSINRHSLTYRISSYIILEAVKKLNYNTFQNKSQVFPCRMKVQWDKDGGRILLGDNTGSRAVILRSVRIQCGFQLHSLEYTFKADHT